MSALSESTRAGCRRLTIAALLPEIEQGASLGAQLRREVHRWAIIVRCAVRGCKLREMKSSDHDGSGAGYMHGSNMNNNREIRREFGEEWAILVLYTRMRLR
jgi:hypothetical protein